MTTAFLNRSRDLATLDEFDSRDTATFMVVCGRRRIGKTLLLQHWAAKHQKYLYWTAWRTTPGLLLAGFSQAVASLTPDFQGEVKFPNWEAAFEHLFRHAASRRMVAVIDEFPYLAECVPEVPSLLQKLWDRHKGDSGLLLVLCGSHYRMMNEQFASRRRPLYGRATARLVVGEISPGEIKLFLPRYSPEQIVETYSVIGGVPGYLEMWDDRLPVMRNIEELIVSGKSLLSEEALLLIHDEIAEPRTYLGILQAMGARRSTPAELAARAAIPVNHIGKYLQTLLELRFIRRILSEDARNRTLTRMTRYEIRDPFLRFHFQFSTSAPT